MSVFVKRLLERSVRAFVAAATAAVAAGVASSNLSMPSIKAILIGAGAAGVSAVMTVLSKYTGDPTSGSFVE